MQAVYTASATATGDGRNGHARSSDGVLDLELAVPEQMGGAGGATNPEQLFAAGYAACFHGALKLVARQEGITLQDTAITVDVGIGDNGKGGFALQVAIEAELPSVDEAKGKQLLEKAHQVCPYSNATRGNVEVSLGLA
ncbi:organic hydroperoxide resistance protein [Motilibacter aurantiacus]|uniref:organic hydroperoxide resistance protein n=1 Tax=Motilibacter aurantiacus TaxID=2714955 RepID=UPI00140BFF6B|nr:organic hydroperoxide resistance protein [Motilibacter aurantiacus]NHC44009.1 organic hydroperoxide resistance protein [Motilibacter aurantiacus]